MRWPQQILLMSGKRKCGKDFIAGRLQSRIGDGRDCELIHISRPIKEHWARENNLDLAQLLSDSRYKETYREQMIDWSEQIRHLDPGHFCRLACNAAVTADIWIVVDIRRRSDIDYFRREFATKSIVRTVRVTANELVRQKRGWIFTKGIDDKETECDLDDYNQWDYVIANNTTNDMETDLQQLLEFLQ